MTLTSSKNSKARIKRKGIMSSALKTKGGKKKRNLEIDTSPGKRSRKTVEFADHE
jgi:hypothetical protein